MCTAASYVSKDHYFGRNLDLEYSYHEQVVVVPRRFRFTYRNGDPFANRAGSVNASSTGWKSGELNHYAMIGMAFVQDGYPLFYDGVNEAGLGMAGLNFPDNCDFQPVQEGKRNIASFEMIPYILSSCATVSEVRSALADVSITNQAFSEKLPPNPLHWMIADRERQIVVEQTKRGLEIYDDPVGVMTNNPTFDVQLTMLSNYRNLTAEQGSSRFAPGLELPAYSRGMGGMGLPGDLSSASRFAKVAFTRMNSVSAPDEVSSVNQFFHILGSVEQQRGLCCLGPDKYEITIYSSCCNQDKGIYYYRTYDNSEIVAVDMHREDLDGETLAAYDLVRADGFRVVN